MLAFLPQYLSPTRITQTRLTRLLFWIVLCLSASFFFSSCLFSLPYIDHPDEPSSYYKALEYRGLYKLNGWDGYPPANLGLNVLVQLATEALGAPRQISSVIP